MSKTLTNLEVGVRVYLDESNQSDFLQTEVDRSINYTMHDVIGSVMEVYEDYYYTTTPKYVSTAINVQEYALDSSLIKIRRVEINYSPADSNSKPLVATAIRTDELPLYLASSNLGGAGLFNAGYYINGSQTSQIIGFTPVPQKVGTNNVSIWGIAAPSDLSSGTDTLPIPYPDRFGYLVELGAAAMLLRKGQQAEAQAAQYMKEYEAGKVMLKNFLKERQADGVHMVVDEQYQDIVFDSPL